MTLQISPLSTGLIRVVLAEPAISQCVTHASAGTESCKNVRRKVGEREHLLFELRLCA